MGHSFIVGKRFMRLGRTSPAASRPFPFIGSFTGSTLRLGLLRWWWAGIVLIVGLAVLGEFFSAGPINLISPAWAQESAEDYFQRGFAAKDQDEKISLFTRAIQLNPSHANAYFFRGIAYSFKGESKPAFRDLEKAISLSPDNPSYYQTRGKIYEKFGDMRRAQEDFAKSKAVTESLKKRGGAPPR